jgi:hypothetical protein
MKALRRTIVPRRRRRHYSYNKTPDEPAKRVAAEPADIEEETPADENEPVENVDTNGSAEAPALEE